MPTTAMGGLIGRFSIEGEGHTTASSLGEQYNEASSYLYLSFEFKKPGEEVLVETEFNFKAEFEFLGPPGVNYAGQVYFPTNHPEGNCTGLHTALHGDMDTWEIQCQGRASSLVVAIVVATAHPGGPSSDAASGP